MDEVRELLDSSLFTLGDTDFTLRQVLLVLVLLIAMIWVARLVRRWTIRIATRRGVHPGVAEAVGGILRYIVFAILVVAIIGTLGVDISGIMVVAGVLGLGIGFGLQGIVNDFVSGVVLLLERPIKVGDRIEVGELAGNVVRISPRATTIRTNDNITIIVPNSQFISQAVINWSHNDPQVRLRVKVPVAYGSDPEQVRRVLVAAASRCEGVLQEPAADVLFDGFGDSSLDFTLRVWTRDLTSRPGMLRSNLNFAVLAALREAGIEIPFPQRVVTLRNADQAS